MPAPSTGKPPLCLHCGHVPPPQPAPPHALPCSLLGHLVLSLSATPAAGSTAESEGSGGSCGHPVPGAEPLRAPSPCCMGTPRRCGRLSAARSEPRCLLAGFGSASSRVAGCHRCGTEGKQGEARGASQAAARQRWAEEEQPAAKAKPEPPCEHRGRQGYPRSEHRMCSAATGPPLSACWNSLLDNYWQVTPSEQHFCLCALAHIHLASASWKESCRAAETRPGKLPAAQQGGERQELLLIPTSPALPQQPGAGRVRDTLIKIENMQQVNSRLSFQVPPPRCCCKRSRCGSLTPGGAALCYFHLARW